MSAYVVQPDHVNALVMFMEKWEVIDHCVPGSEAHLQEAAELLWNENVKAVCHRYRGDSPEQYGSIQFVRDNYALTHLKAIDVLKMISCLEYQCAEYDGWDGSPAYLKLQQLKDRAISRLDGYANAVRDYSLPQDAPKIVSLSSLY